MADMTQGPGATAQTASPAQSAQSAQLDAQLEIEAKKAALRGLQQQNAAGGPATGPEAPPAPPAPPGAGGTTIMIEKDGKTIVLENPTAEQLNSLGLSTQPSGPVNPFDRMEPQQVTTLGIVAIVAAVAVAYMLINAFRRGRAATPPAESREFSARMSRIENAIESVALEVERISEAQRFTTRVLSEGVAQQVQVPERQPALQQNRGGM